MNKIVRGSIWWADIPYDPCNPHAQYGIRPVVIVSNDKGNEASSSLLVCPLSTKKDKYFFIHPQVRGVRNQISYILCEQIKVLDKALLGDYITHLSEYEESAMDKALLFELGLSKYVTEVKEDENTDQSDNLDELSEETHEDEEKQLGRCVLNIIDIIKKHTSVDSSQYSSSILSNIEPVSKYARNEMGWTDEKVDAFLNDYVHLSPKDIVKKYNLDSFKIATRYFKKYK